jgi:hypothetical protein
MTARNSRRRLPSTRLNNASKEVPESGGNIIGVAVSHGSAGPCDAEAARGPNAIERAFVWGGEPPSVDEVARWRTYNLNKELADDLSGHVAIEVSGFFIRSSSELLVGKMKKRVRKV